jgi:hypothetical protein
MKLKYLKLQLIFYSKYKDVKRKLKERANNQRKIINERKKGNMLNKKKKKVTS